MYLFIGRYISISDAVRTQNHALFLEHNYNRSKMNFLKGAEQTQVCFSHKSYRAPSLPLLDNSCIVSKATGF